MRDTPNIMLYESALVDEYGKWLYIPPLAGGLAACAKALPLALVSGD